MGFLLHPAPKPVIISPESPWANWTPAHMRFCENILPGLVSQPANTYSSLIYILIGIWLTLKSRPRDNPGAAFILQWWGPVEIAVGVGSVFFHMSSTFIGEFMDLSAMYFFSSLSLVFNMRRHGWLTHKQEPWAFIFFSALGMILLALYKDTGIAYFAISVAVTFLLEMNLFRNPATRAKNYRYFWTGIFFFIAAQIFWQLDVRDIMCDGDNHWFQGHALWHITNSFCFYWLWKFGRGIKVPGEPKVNWAKVLKRKKRG